VNDETRGLGVISCSIDGEGRLWVLTYEGVIVYDYGKERYVPTPPPVYISHFSVNGNPVKITQQNRFAYDENNVTIDYVGISLKNPSGVEYRYVLEGAEQTWSSFTTQSRITYATLNPGSYRFAVSAQNGDGVLSTDSASVSFTIGLPYWREWWFILLANVLVIAVIGLGARRRVQKLHRDRRLHEEFSKQLLASQEEERKRIAAELHDSIGQDLLVIKNHSAMGLNAAPADPQLLDHLKEINDISSEAMQDVRRISYNLRPYQIDRLGMTRALQSLVDGFSSSASLACAVRLDPIDGILDKPGEINLYRIVQEILNNIAKHSGAARVEVNMERTENSTISLEVTDDGKGLPEEYRTGTFLQAGLGLESIAERVRILGGTHSISSATGQGTTIRITIPYDGRRQNDIASHS
jgi:signal transduction histidine kinase